MTNFGLDNTDPKAMTGKLRWHGLTLTYKESEAIRLMLEKQKTNLPEKEITRPPNKKATRLPV